MSEKLKPCPFCGGSGQVRYDYGSGQVRYDYGNLRGLKRWNRRANDEV